MMITTTYGEIEESFLTPNHSIIDNDHERTEVTEYLLEGEVVHRSVHVHLKHGLGVEGAIGGIGG